ncbi:glutaminase A [Pyxidicoccus parkwayensis]|uniref:Glutaminase n=1 Tax=Pyxidicoccus parkwayensis TaxID=2813578 RepID=A0ABX7P8E0_9BACT|nr:glutaminase A [Pyxidicoccus parkwaysis]QSQ26682.1 glutaminase A [Pyxidicoccus parkwaysis]
MSAALRELHDSLLSEEGGTLATYIPELARVDPALFGLALATLDGRVHAAGDADVPFTLQSISKPFVYARALADLGLEAVLSRVGAEPSGEAFNAISLEPGTGRPSNPMVNAGAILTTSLVSGDGPAARFERIRDTLSAFAGRRLELDEAVLASELETGDRNRALAYLMRNAGALRCEVDEALDVYFRQCALLATAEDVAVMAATLANGGVNPRTKEAVVPGPVAEHVLALMASCGMYDGAGEWLLRVGLPAKSGVSGGIVAVSPGQFGIGLFSPRLDVRGNSVRGVAASRVLAERFQLHLMHYPGRTAPVIARSGDARTLRSRRLRRRAERDVLHQHGGAIHLRALQGDIEFAAAESVLQSLGALPGKARWLVLELEGVTRLHPIAARMLDAAVAELGGRGIAVVTGDVHRRGLLPHASVEHASVEEAQEECEDALLARHGALLSPDTVLAWEAHDAWAALDEEARAALAAALPVRAYGRGERVLAQDGEELFLVLSGRVGLYGPGVRGRRLGSAGPGTAVQRPGQAGGGLVAELSTSGRVLGAAQQERLERERPRVLARLWKWLAGVGRE